MELHTRNLTSDRPGVPPSSSPTEDCPDDETAWARFTRSFGNLSFVPSTDGLSDKVVDLIMPDWIKMVPGYVRKLQREMNMAPGSLAAEIWKEARDPYTHPEIQYQAKVRVSGQLCDEEKTFLERRKKMLIPALARYLGIEEKEIHPDDVPTIAMCGSGGGLRALVAGSGSFLATAEDGLFDCTTYVSGVSGSCWLQSLYYSSVTGGDFQQGISHLKARLGTHIAYPPVAFTSLTSSPTNKYLLSGLVEKLKGDPEAQFGLVDIYGVLLAARLLVPKGQLGINEKDFKLSNQRDYVKYGQNPLPIYTAVRHEIPEFDSPDYGGPGSLSEEAKDRAKREAWFQWFEITPYEFFCEEFSAGIPTWAMGRKFKNGSDLPSASGYRLPEVRMPLLLGIWGSAFCATLSHYYREVRPLVQSLTGFQSVDELIWGHNNDLSKVHPIEPASIPNFAHGMYGQLPDTVPQAVYDNEYIQLMDAGIQQTLKPESLRQTEAAHELGYCTVWVGTTEERSSDHPPLPVDDTSSWRLMEPDAGITVVYMPFLANEKAVPGVDVAVSDYMSTWNFVYTPTQVDEVVKLARANYAEGREQIRATGMAYLVSTLKKP
ncbi:hypothetical protein N0V88_003040 [Collariella sp. IMI 366227]|nr:hypothetical protein N0V88_003040 [Collariella sp. IMI 366227]